MELGLPLASRGFCPILWEQWGDDTVTLSTVEWMGSKLVHLESKDCSAWDSRRRKAVGNNIV